MTRVTAMMRMIMELVMVLAVVGGLMFMMKVSAKEEGGDAPVRDYGDGKGPDGEGGQ